MVKYFVSFWHVKSGGFSGVGNCEVHLKGKIETKKDIEDIEDYLKLIGNYQAVVITWKRLEE